MALGMAKNGLEYLKAVEERKARIAKVNAKRGGRTLFTVDDSGNVGKGMAGRVADPAKRVYGGAINGGRQGKLNRDPSTFKLTKSNGMEWAIDKEKRQKQIEDAVGMPMKEYIKQNPALADGLDDLEGDFATWKTFKWVFNTPPSPSRDTYETKANLIERWTQKGLEEAYQKYPVLFGSGDINDIKTLDNFFANTKKTGFLFSGMLPEDVFENAKDNQVDVAKIKKEFKKLSQKYHPDKGGSEAQFKILNEIKARAEKKGELNDLTSTYREVYEDSFVGNKGRSQSPIAVPTTPTKAIATPAKAKPKSTEKAIPPNESSVNGVNPTYSVGRFRNGEFNIVDQYDDSAGKKQGMVNGAIGIYKQGFNTSVVHLPSGMILGSLNDSIYSKGGKPASQAEVMTRAKELGNKFNKLDSINEVRLDNFPKMQGQIRDLVDSAKARYAPKTTAKPDRQKEAIQANLQKQQTAMKAKKEYELEQSRIEAEYAKRESEKLPQSVNDVVSRLGIKDGTIATNLRRRIEERIKNNSITTDDINLALNASRSPKDLSDGIVAGLKAMGVTVTNPEPSLSQRKNELTQQIREAKIAGDRQLLDQLTKERAAITDQQKAEASTPAKSVSQEKADAAIASPNPKTKAKVDPSLVVQTGLGRSVAGDSMDFVLTPEQASNLNVQAKLKEMRQIEAKNVRSNSDLIKYKQLVDEIFLAPQREAILGVFSSGEREKVMAAMGIFTRDFKANNKNQAIKSNDFVSLRNIDAGKELRKKDDNAEFRDAVEGIRLLLSKAPKHEGSVYRGIRFGGKKTEENRGDRDKFLAELKEKGEMDLDAFSSFSTRQSVAEGFAGLAGGGADGTTSIIFRVNDNKSGVNVSAFSKVPDESEVLVPKNTRYKVVNIEENEIGYQEMKGSYRRPTTSPRQNIVYVDLEEIPSAPSPKPDESVSLTTELTPPAKPLSAQSKADAAIAPTKISAKNKTSGDDDGTKKDKSTKKQHKPFMTKAEAEKYVEGSLWQDRTLFHGAIESSADNIITNGIKIEKNKIGMYGQGFYTGITIGSLNGLDIAKSYASEYASYEKERGKILEMKVIVNNPLTMANEKDFLALVRDARDKGEIPSPATDPKTGRADMDAYAEYTKGIRTYFKKLGYDAIEISSLGYAVIFDSDQVAIYGNHDLDNIPESVVSSVKAEQQSFSFNKKGVSK